jgi:hypothetical protein
MRRFVACIRVRRTDGPDRLKDVVIHATSWTFAVPVAKVRAVEAGGELVRLSEVGYH